MIGVIWVLLSMGRKALVFMDLNECRQHLDKIDDEILELFSKRMEIVSAVADFKRANSMPVLQKDREREILDRISENSTEELSGYSRLLFSSIMDISRSYQAARNSLSGTLSEKIKTAIAETNSCFPKNCVVACQGIDGAYSSLACDKILPGSDILYFKSFEGVFSAIDKGLCKYGILPIENSIHGSVNQVYDLMKNFSFYIVRSLKLKINHALLAKGETALSDITDIYSHEQAIGQCSQFLKEHPNIRVHICENTAVAAKFVSESDCPGAASISSPECASLYGLNVVCNAVADSDSNFTRFICISKNLEIYPGANKISLTLRALNKPGALYSLISRFAVLGINITKLESRPIAGRNFEYLFYFDIDASVYSAEVLRLLDEFCSDPENAVFLGSYTEL